MLFLFLPFGLVAQLKSEICDCCFGIVCLYFVLKKIGRNMAKLPKGAYR